MNEVEIFSKASEIDDPVQRQAFLDRVCGGNVELKQRLEAFLQSADVAGSFMESPAPVQAIAANPDPTMASQDGELVVADKMETHVLGDFRILQEIGRGGMGVVYEAEQISLGRRVALKVLPYASMLDNTQLTRFQNEARAAASLEHPNVVHVHSVGTERGVHYFAMQLIRGQSLDEMAKVERRKRGILEHTVDESPRKSSGHEPTSAYSIPDAAASEEKDVGDTVVDAASAATTRHDANDKVWIRSVVELAIQAAEALEHAHRMGIVHRDIKPSNLLIDADQHLWVADFGLALIEADANLTTSGSMIGTLRYMSPEQLRGDRHVLDHHTDIYSLGTTFYEMLTLRPAFPDSDVTQLMQRIPNEEPTAPHKLNSAIPRDLETIVLKAINKQPQDRYTTAGALAEDLRSFLDDKPIRARRPSWVDQAKKWTRRHKGGVATALITLAVAVLFASVFLWRERSHTLAALDREREQSHRAEANLQLAMQALDDLYLKSIGEEKLLRDETHRPGFSEREKELLRRGLTFYDRFAQQNRENPEAAFETGKAFCRVALLQVGLGQNDEAQAAYAESILRLKKLTEQHPTRSEYFLELGKAYYGQGRLSRWWPSATNTFSEAEAALSKVIDLDPKSIEAFDLRGKVHKVTGELDEAVADAKMTVRLDPNNPSWHIQLAFLLWTVESPHLRDLKRALRHAQRAVELDPRHSNNRAVLGSIHFSLGQREAAVAEYQKAIELEDLPHRANFRRFQLAQMLNDTKGIIEHASKCLDDSVPLASTNLAWMHEKRGQAYQSRGEIEKALSDYKRAEQMFPNRSDIYWRRGDLLTGQERYREALGDYNKFLELAPFRWHVYKRRAKAYFHLGHYDRALADLEKSLALEPNDLSCLSWIDLNAVASCPDASFRQGIIALADRAIEVTVASADAYVRRAGLFAGFGQYDKARDDYEKSFELGTSTCYSRYQYALVCLQSGNRKTYRTNCAAMLKEFAKSSDTNQRYFTAWTCVLAPNAVDDYSPTLKLAEQAAGEDPKAACQRCLGAVLYRAGRFDEAIETLGIAESAESDEGSLAYTWYFLAMAQNASARPDEAKRWLQKAVAWTEQAFLAEEEDGDARLAWNRRLTLKLLREEAESAIGKEQR